MVDSSILLAVITGVWSLAIPALMMVITPQDQKTLSTFLLYLSGGVTVGAGSYVFGYQAGRRNSHPLDSADELPPLPPIDERFAFHVADPVNGSAVTGVMKVRGTYIRLPKGFDGSSRLWLCMESNLNYRFYQIVDVNFDPMNQNWHVDVDFDFKNGTACTVRVLWVDTVTDAFLKANAGKIVRQYPSVGTIEQVSQLVTLKLSLPVARPGGNEISPANWQSGEITGLTPGVQPGTIKSGFIMGNNGQEYFFNPYLLFFTEQASDLKQGIKVVFEPQPPLPGGKNPQATKIFLIDSMISVTLEQDIPAGMQGNDRIQTVVSRNNYTHGLLVRNLSGQLVTAGSQVNCKITTNSRGPVAVIQ
jgi:hypothetical protein